MAAIKGITKEDKYNSVNRKWRTSLGSIKWFSTNYLIGMMSELTKKFIETAWNLKFSWVIQNY